MTLTLKTAAAETPVTDAELKLFAKIDTTADDALVTALNKVATNFIQDQLQQSLVNETWTLTQDGFGCKTDPHTGKRMIEICRTPLVSVTHVKYYDDDGVQQTLASTEYEIDTKSNPSRIVEAPLKTWPSVQTKINSVEVEFVAGFDAAKENIREEYKEIIKLYFTHLYEHREIALEREYKEVPFTISALLDQYRLKVFG